MSTLDYQEWLKKYTALTDSVNDLHDRLAEMSYQAKLSLSTAVLRLIKESTWQINGGTTAVWLCAASDEWAVKSRHPVIDALSYLFPHGTFTVISGKNEDGFEIDVCNLNYSDGHWTLSGVCGGRDNGEWGYLDCMEFIKQLNLSVNLMSARNTVEAEIKYIQKKMDRLTKQKAELTDKLNSMRS